MDTTYKFSSVIDGDFIHADRKGGDTYYNIPRGSSPLSGGKIGKISLGKSESTDINGGIPLGIANFSFSKNSGTSWQIQNLMDINGDMYPDIVTYTGDRDGSNTFNVIEGTGSGFGDIKTIPTMRENICP